MRKVRLMCFLALAFASPLRVEGQGNTIQNAKLEVNLGPMFIDWYDGTHLNDNQRAVKDPNNSPGCSAAQVYRDCIKSILAGYKSQGVVGVRFFLGMTGPPYGTAFVDSSGNPGNPNSSGPKVDIPNPTYMSNLGLFFQDLRAANIKYVTFTPDISGHLGVDVNYMNMTYCYLQGVTTNTSEDGIASPDNRSCATGQTALNYYPWLPFPQYYGTAVPYMTSNADGYNNELYLLGSHGSWTWGAGSPFLAFFDRTLTAAQNAALIVREVDLLAETSLSQHPVVARMIYNNVAPLAANQDTLTGVPVLAILGQYMQNHGFDSGAVILSSPAGDPAYWTDPVTGQSVLHDCGSYWGDSALIIDASEFAAAVGGYPFGLIDSSDSPSGNLSCGSKLQTPATPLPAAQASPALTDIHAYPAVANSDTEQASGTSPIYSTGAAAQMIFNDIWWFHQNHGLTANTIMIGETDPNSPDQCEGCVCNDPTGGTDCGFGIWHRPNTPEAAMEDGQGFVSSSLDRSNVVLRPFAAVSNYYARVPMNLGGMNGPYQPKGGGCTYSVSPASVQAPASGWSGNVTVTTGSSCDSSIGPPLPSQAPFTGFQTAWPAGITVNRVNNDGSQTPCSFPSTQCWASGAGTWSIQIGSNTGAARQFKLSVAGQAVTILQNAPVATVPITFSFYDWNGNAMSGAPALTVDGTPYVGKPQYFTLSAPQGAQTISASTPAGYSPTAEYKLSIDGAGATYDPGMSIPSFNLGPTDNANVLWVFLPNDLPVSYFPATVTGNTTYKAYQTIEAMSTVGVGANLTLQAGSTITLQPGFHALPGCTFTALISNTW